MLDAEQLTGDNQYYCEFCGIKFDATRQLCLHELPPYLCFSLKRFVFDMKVGITSSCCCCLSCSSSMRWQHRCC